MQTASVKNRCWSAVLLLAFCLAFSATAASQTHIRLVLSAESAKPGDTVWAGLQMDMPDKWHVYWRNGGDAGIAPTITWDLPQGVSAGEINWPAPAKEIDKAGDASLVTYVYTNQTVLLIPIKLADDAPSGSLSLKANVHWMECSEEAGCVLTKGDVAADLNVGLESKPSADAGLLEQWRKKVPAAIEAGAATAYWQGTEIVSNARPVVIEWKGGTAPADFYPDANTNFSLDGVTQTLTSDNGVIALRKMLTKNGDVWPDHLSGILVSMTDSTQRHGFEVSVPIGPPRKAAKPAAAPVAPGALATMLLFAFLGGLILNIMPCVLPVIALKIFAFVKQAGEKPGRVRNLGLVYGVGVLVSFLGLALLAIAAQEAGRLANWGDLFRNPNVQLGLTVLVTLIALNLFGVFEVTLSSRAAGAAGELASHSGFSGAFFNGVLATVLATPCTAPFLGAALAFALAQSAGVIVLFFLTAGVGFACPFVILCAKPGWMKWLPKPGKWMERFKVAMGFPMLATAFWLLWLSANDQSSFLWLGLFLVVLALAAWIWGEFVQRSFRGKGFSAALCVVLLALDYTFVLRGHTSEIQWQPWSQQAVEEAQKAGHPVLVDFTAKSCLTCQLNKASSIEIPSTRSKLQEIGAVALMGDDTRDNPAIDEQLRLFGRSGLPLVLVYSKNGSKTPEVLPTLLTPSIVLKALDLASRN